MNNNFVGGFGNNYNQSNESSSFNFNSPGGFEMKRAPSSMSEKLAR
jgi:hypothetical protein